MDTVEGNFDWTVVIHGDERSVFAPIQRYRALNDIVVSVHILRWLLTSSGSLTPVKRDRNRDWCAVVRYSHVAASFRHWTHL